MKRHETVCALALAIAFLTISGCATETADPPAPASAGAGAIGTSEALTYQTHEFDVVWSGAGVRSTRPGRVQLRSGISMGRLRFTTPDGEAECTGVYTGVPGVWTMRCWDGTSASGRMMKGLDGAPVGRGDDTRGRNIAFRIATLAEK